MVKSDLCSPPVRSSSLSCMMTMHGDVESTDIYALGSRDNTKHQRLWINFVVCLQRLHHYRQISWRSPVTVAWKQTPAPLFGRDGDGDGNGERWLWRCCGNTPLHLPSADFNTVRLGAVCEMLCVVLLSTCLYSYTDLLRLTQMWLYSGNLKLRLIVVCLWKIQWIIY